MLFDMRSPSNTSDIVIKENFDVSVVLPYYKKLRDFKITLLKNHFYFQRNGIEVILVLDEPSEQCELLSYLKNYPMINWRVIVNEHPHEWRNPSKAINVGIKNATKKYILVMGPDSEMASDVIFLMRQMSHYYEKCFFVGRVAFIDYDYIPSEQDLRSFHYWDYGSIFAEKEFFVAVGGYDEGYEKWGGDDDNIRARLERYGLRKIKINKCLLLHRENKIDLENLRKNDKNIIINQNPKALKQSFYPHNHIANLTKKWGEDFNKLIWDWKDNRYAEELCTSYLDRGNYKDFSLGENAFGNQYKIIALVQTYNEERNIQSLLRHLDEHCDGIILLDDASEDETYSLAKSDKLLLKVQKNYRHRFDDLANRNTLLDLASFFSSEFFFFMDADERFDQRYSDLYSAIESRKSDTICFYLVHLWNHDETYRTDVPEHSPINQPGVLHRWRLFKNIGRMQINGARLHFQATPYKMKKYIAPILIKHYGLLGTELRQVKYERYMTEDDELNCNPDKYQYFLNNSVQVKPVIEITLPEFVVV